MDNDDLVPLTVARRPALWQPNSIAFWSLFFTPVFGAYLLAANWQALGRPDRARANVLCMWLGVMLLAVCLGVMSVIPAGGQALLVVAWVGLWVGWCLVRGRGAQVRYIRRTVGDDYPRREWGGPLLAGIAGLVACSVAAGTVANFATALRPQESRAESAGPGSPPAPPKDRRHTEPEGKFSFVPPDGWRVIDPPDARLRYKVTAGPSRDGFTPNLIVMEDESDLSSKAYAEEVTRANVKMSPTYRVVDRRAFVTSEKLSGYRVASESRPSGKKKTRHLMFVFGRGGRKIVVTTTTLADGGAELDPVFDECMKSFRFEN